MNRCCLGSALVGVTVANSFMSIGRRTNFVIDTHVVECSDTGPFLEGLKNTPIFLPSALCSSRFRLYPHFYTYYRTLLTTV
jgi:hypothetical protein